MSQVWKMVATGGKVVLSDAASGGTTLMDGLGIEDCSLSVRQQASEFRPMENTSPQRFPGVLEYRVSFNRGIEDTRIAGQTAQSVVALVDQDRIYCIYKDANGVVLFSGWTTWEDASDTQRGQDAARQAMALVNDGDPVVPASDADPSTWPYATV